MSVGGGSLALVLFKFDNIMMRFNDVHDLPSLIKFLFLVLKDLFVFFAALALIGYVLTVVFSS